MSHIPNFSLTSSRSSLHAPQDGGRFAYSNITWKYATTHEIEKIVESLKNTNYSGYDEITARLLKLSTPYTISPHTHICNSALSSDVFPNRLNYAIVTPSHKNGDSHLISNYRPISIYIYTSQRDTQRSSTDCLLMLRCQLYIFRTVTVHPQEPLFRCGMCRLWYAVRTALSDTSRWYSA